MCHIPVVGGEVDGSEAKTIVEKKNNTQYRKEMVHLINKTRFCQCLVHAYREMIWKQLFGYEPK